jgi:hypothetical protein
MTAPMVGASPLVAALEQVWAAIRRRHPEVPEVVVVVAAGGEGRRLRWGHFASGRWQLPAGRRPEVLVGGEGLRRPAREVLGTLLHEAAHGLADRRGIQDTSRGGRYHCEGAAVWAFQTEDAPGEASGAGLTRAITGRACLAVDSSAVFLGAFSVPPACPRDLIGARRRASSQCCPRSGWWAPPLSADEGGDGHDAPCRVPGHRWGRQPQGAARSGRAGPAGPPPWRLYGGDHPARVWAAGTLGPQIGCHPAVRDRGHRQLRRRAGSLAGCPRPPGGGGHPAQPPDPTPPWQVRPDRRRSRRPSGAGRPRAGAAQGCRRDGGDAAGAADGPPLGHEGPHPDRPAAGQPGRYRAGPAPGQAASTVAGAAGRGGGGAAPRRAGRPTDRDQAWPCGP